MPIKVTTKGYIEVFRGNDFVSRHRVETEAFESVVAHSEANGDGVYELRFPVKVVDVSRLDRIYVATDTTAPLAPAGITAQALSKTQILVEWTAVTDPSGVTYSLERGDGTTFSALTTTTGLQYTDTVAAGSTYSYRVRAYDSVPNYGAYSPTATAATPSYLAPDWLIADTPYSLGSTTPGGVLSISSTYAANDGVPAFTFVSATNAAAQPVTVAVDSATGAITAPSTADQYSVVIDLADASVSTAEQDWLARSTGAGVTFASDFSGPSDFVTVATNGGHVYAGGMDPAVLARVVKDLTDGLTNGCCLRIDTPASAGANSAAWQFPLNSAWTSNAQSFGSAEFYIQFRFKIPASRLVLTNCGGNQRGWKWMNIAQYSPTNTIAQSFSNTQAEHVLQDTNQRGLPQAYHNPAFEPFQGSAGGQITLQTAVDRGLPLTGGDRYCHYPNGTPGCYFFPTDEWMTFMARIKVASYGGSTGNEFDLWFARKDATEWTQLFNDRNYAVGSPNSSGGGFTGLNGAHLLNYETNRINSTVDTWVKYDQIIVSTLPIALPAVGA